MYSELSELQKDKIQKFLGDEIMSETIRYVLREVFVKKRSNDVSFLAGQMIAFNLLDEGFKELEKCQVERTSDTSNQLKQVGV